VATTRVSAVVIKKRIFMFRSCVGAVSSCGHVNGKAEARFRDWEKQATGLASEHVARTRRDEGEIANEFNA
jgi:hypothetical protein